MITHDLGVVAEIADDVIVMYAGQVVETGTVDEIFAAAHPYTWGLLGSLPRIDAEVERLRPDPGTPPSLLNPPRGCRFNPAARTCMGLCRVGPSRRWCRSSHQPQHLQACHLERGNEGLRGPRSWLEETLAEVA